MIQRNSSTLKSDDYQQCLERSKHYETEEY